MINNIKDILNQMQTNFPVEQCIYLNDEELQLESKQKYICVVYEDNIKNYYQIIIATPYIVLTYDDNKELIDDKSWGWMDDTGNGYPNFENPSLGWNDKVIAFSPYIE